MSSIDAANLNAFPEALLRPCVLHPIQFQEIWGGVRHSSERELAVAIIERAAGDLQAYRHATHRRQQILYWNAYQWVATDDCSWPFSFLSICHALEFSASALRDRILDAMPARVAREAA